MAINEDAQSPVRSLDGALCLPEKAEVNEPAEQQRVEFSSVFPEVTRGEHSGLLICPSFPARYRKIRKDAKEAQVTWANFSKRPS